MSPEEICRAGIIYHIRNIKIAIQYGGPYGHLNYAVDDFIYYTYKFDRVELVHTREFIDKHIYHFIAGGCIMNVGVPTVRMLKLAIIMNNINFFEFHMLSYPDRKNIYNKVVPFASGHTLARLKDKGIFTADVIIRCARHGRIDLIKYFEIIPLTQKQINTAVHTGAKYPEIVRYLVGRGAVPNTVGLHIGFLNTLLVAACRASNLPAVRALVLAGANNFCHAFKAAGGDRVIIDYLLQHRAAEPEIIIGAARGLYLEAVVDIYVFSAAKLKYAAHRNKLKYVRFFKKNKLSSFELYCKLGEDKFCKLFSSK